MKKFVILLVLTCTIEGITAQTLESPDNSNMLMQVAYWMLSITGSSLVVWFMARFFNWTSKAGNGKTS